MARHFGRLGPTIAAGVALAASAAFATSASASTTSPTSPQDCPAGYVCLWHDQNYTGPRFILNHSSPHLGENSDEAHSVDNNTGQYARLFDHDNWQGPRVCVRPDGQIPDLGGFGDATTSVELSGFPCA